MTKNPINMSEIFTCYLSLGSNLNNKLENLKDAVNEINVSAGSVISISNTYSTSALGFDGKDFYNICVKIKTKLSPKELLNNILNLEKKLGRKAKTIAGYENRCIDIDIIIFENQKIKSSELTIPHPRALDRNFVLVPLLDIFTENSTPFNSKSLKENLKNCSDQSPIAKLSYKINL